MYKVTKQKEHVMNEKDVMNMLSEIEGRYYPILHETMQDTKGLYFLLDYIPGGELSTFLKSRLTIEMEGVKFYLAEVVIALEQLHELGIVYRDLKPENIIIDKDGHIKLIDFGFAKVLKEGEQTYTNCGTPSYMAPEIIQKCGHDHRSDIWAFGVLMCDLIGRFTPFYDQNPTKMYENIIHCRAKWPKNMCKISRDLASRILVTDPNMRVTFDEIKHHLFFSGMDWKKAKSKKLDPFFIPEIQNDWDINHFKTKLTEKEIEKIQNYDAPLTIADYFSAEVGDQNILKDF